MTASNIKAEIAHELCLVLEMLDADSDLLSIIGSWGDTLGDEEILSLLRDYNASGKVLQQRQ